MVNVTATQEALAASYAGLAKVARLHTGAPGSAGTANEVTGGSPAYAPKAITWNAGTVDGVYTSDPIDFDVPACDPAYVTLWDGTVGAPTTYRDSATVSGHFTAQGVFRVTLTYTQG